MTPYATATDRARALYRIATAPTRNRTLEICHGHEPLLPGQRWPGVVHAVALGQAGEALPTLPVEPQSFDLMILHRTLDDLAAATRPGAVIVVQGFLQQVSRLLTPGGVATGCFQKLDALDVIVQRLRTKQPAADCPRKVFDDDGSVSHFAFMREIAVRRRQLSLPANATRRLAARLGLNQRVAPAVFFWAHQPC